MELRKENFLAEDEMEACVVVLLLANNDVEFWLIVSVFSGVGGAICENNDDGRASVFIAPNKDDDVEATPTTLPNNDGFVVASACC